MRRLGSPTRSFAGTPAILPWATAPGADGNGHSVWAARSATSDDSSSATEKPASGSTIASGSSISTAVAPIPSASSGAIRTTSTSSPVQRAPSSAAAVATTWTEATGSSAGTSALRVVEGGGGDGRLAAVDQDPVGKRHSPLPAEHQRPTEQRRRPAAGDVADDLAVLDRPDRRAFGRRTAVHREADPAPRLGQRRRPLQRAPADELRLLHPDGPVHPEPPRTGVELGVHAD